MAILKSRFGQSGQIFENIRFDNATIQIDMGENQGARTQNEILDDKQAAKNARVASMLKLANDRKAMLDGIKIIE
jgi:hypothetical protein